MSETSSPRRRFPAAAIAAAVMLAGAASLADAAASDWRAADTGETARFEPRTAQLRAQVLLDRAAFSPGEIDALEGSNVARALRAFQTSRALAVTGKLDDETWAALDADTAPVLRDYVITADDVAGPFVALPDDMMEKAKLERLGYASPLEALAEKFHASPALLESLNPGRDFSRAGESIVVPAIGDAPLATPARVVVDRSESTVALLDDAGAVYAMFPATTGSEHDPLPLGEWTIRGIAQEPKFHYNPELFWDANESHAKATVAPGPNNPVGVAWIDLSKEHYGIHGTPEPAKLAKSESHGCIRVANWSVAALAEAVKPGIVAELRE